MVFRNRNWLPRHGRPHSLTERAVQSFIKTISRLDVFAAIIIAATLSVVLTGVGH